VIERYAPQFFEYVFEESRSLVFKPGRQDGVGNMALDLVVSDDTFTLEQCFER
jgi:hypothetical protein